MRDDSGMQDVQYTEVSLYLITVSSLIIIIMVKKILSIDAVLDRLPGIILIYLSVAMDDWVIPDGSQN